MPSTMRRELRDNIGDQLRGLRHLVRSLGSDTPEIRIANHSLPPLPPELNRLFGATFQTVDGVMGTLKTIATPFRPCRASSYGFRRFDDYFGLSATHSDEALTDDLYAALKLVARSQDSTRFVLKARVAEICKKLFLTARSGKWTNEDLGECCSTLFLQLVQARPLAESDVDDAELWKTYAAVSLAFGLSLSGRLSKDDFAKFAEGDALLICGQRRSSFLDATNKGTATPLLIKTYESLLRHLP